MIDKLLEPLFAPFKEAWSKFMGAKNLVDGAAGDVNRLKKIPKDLKNKAEFAKKQAEDLKKKGKGALDAAKGAQKKLQGGYDQAQGAAAQAQGYLPPGGAPPPPGMQAPPRPGMPGHPQAQVGPMGAAMGGMPPMNQMGGFPMGGTPMQPMGASPMPMQPPGPGNRTMAIVAGGTSGAAIGWLVPVKGALRGELITLKPMSVIGKDPTCDVVFNDPFLSGRHATIRAQNGLFVLEDHSTNGTWVNDRKIQRHELVDNDFVKFGQTMVKFKAL